MESKKYKQWLEQADHMAQQFQNASVVVGRDYRARTITGVDVNELNKLYSVLIAEKNVQYIEVLLNKLINSQFCRTGKTQGYYRNIKKVLQQNNFFQMELEQAKFVLGWVCRLMKYYKTKG